MKVAVLCEFSGTVRDAFTRKGHEAVSFDLIDTEIPGNHIIADVLSFDLKYWEQYDLLICHPPCTYLATVGCWAHKTKEKEIENALKMVKWMMDLPCKRIAIENPVSLISSKIRKPDQIIQPWMFGHKSSKATCLWLKNVPPLFSTDIRQNPKKYLDEVKTKSWKDRSRTYTGIAKAMADQWGFLEK